jgi:hypothetical protein
VTVGVAPRFHVGGNQREVVDWLELPTAEINGLTQRQVAKVIYIGARSHFLCANRLIGAPEVLVARESIELQAAGMM